ncbi:hypothetical protein X801_06791, partial [Opisthorchis viverrini]
MFVHRTRSAPITGAVMDAPTKGDEQTTHTGISRRAVDEYGEICFETGFCYHNPKALYDRQHKKKIDHRCLFNTEFVLVSTGSDEERCPGMGNPQPMSEHNSSIDEELFYLAYVCIA